MWMDQTNLKSTQNSPSSPTHIFFRISSTPWPARRHNSYRRLERVGPAPSVIIALASRGRRVSARRGFCGEPDRSGPDKRPLRQRLHERGSRRRRHLSATERKGAQASPNAHLASARGTSAHFPSVSEGRPNLRGGEVLKPAQAGVRLFPGAAEPPASGGRRGMSAIRKCTNVCSISRDFRVIYNCNQQVRQHLDNRTLSP